jgi:DNA-binding transcriptional LysR family regulator
MDNPIVVLAPPDHPLANKKKIPLERIAKEPWLMREKGSGTRNAIERRFIEHGITLHPRLELGSNEAIKQAILAGLGISALSRHALALNQPGQFAVLDVEGFPILRHWYAVYPAGRQLSVVARAFLDYLLGRSDAAPAVAAGKK